MSQETRVLQVDADTAARLQRTFQDGLPTAEWRRAPHTRFALKADGVVITCYTSGKLVIQGRGLDTFAARFLEGLGVASASRSAARSGDPELPFDAPTVGSDEAGKGDYFGPLVVAAVHATPADRAALTELGVADSKTISDLRVRRLAATLERQLDHEILSLEPAAYNRRHAAVGNVDLLLAELHAEAVARLIARHPMVEVAIVDRFGAESLVADRLAARCDARVRLLQVPRAERHPAVAAASIIARAAFLDGLAACAESAASDLHKGAGPPVDEAGRRVAAIGGRTLLATVAKLHFKNTGRVLR